MALTQVLGSEALRRAVIHFVVHRHDRLHFRALQRHLDLSRQSLKNALDILISLGLLRAFSEGNRVAYAPTDHPGWEGLGGLVRTLEDPAEVLGHLLNAIPGIRAAFVFGSHAKHAAHAGSDVDLLLLEDEAVVDRARIAAAILDAAAVLGREIDVKYFTAERLRREMERPGTSYVKRVLEGPKRWVVGTPQALAA